MIAALTDLVYGVPLRRQGIAARWPEEELRVLTASKAVRSGDELPLERGAHWATARRNLLAITDRRLACGDWEVPFDAIRRARVLRFRSLLSSGAVLVIDTDEAHYQFGVQAGSWLDALPFEVEPVEGGLGLSPFSVGVRVLLFVGLVGWLALRCAG